jgi:hypothetical protein
VADKPNEQGDSDIADGDMNWWIQCESKSLKMGQNMMWQPIVHDL